MSYETATLFDLRTRLIHARRMKSKTSYELSLLTNESENQLSLFPSIVEQIYDMTSGEFAKMITYSPEWQPHKEQIKSLRRLLQQYKHYEKIEDGIIEAVRSIS